MTDDSIWERGEWEPMAPDSCLHNNNNPNYSWFGPVVSTASGATFNLAAPDAADVRFADVACSLAGQYRFSGHPGVHYSVAEHSLLVAATVNHTLHGTPYQTLLGLLHDAAETYTGDINGPVKSLIPAIRELEDSIFPHILIAAGLPQPSAEDHRIVKEADVMVTALEGITFLPGVASRPDIPHVTAIGGRITMFPAEKARQLYTACLNRLFLAYSQKQDTTDNAEEPTAAQ